MKSMKIKNSVGQEFIFTPGDHLTLVPVVHRKPPSWLYRLWMRVAPEVWRRHKRMKSHRAYLKKMGDPVVSHFGSEGHIWIEKLRVQCLPPVEFNNFDPRPRTHKERSDSLKAIIRDALQGIDRSDDGTPQA